MKTWIKVAIACVLLAQTPLFAADASSVKTIYDKQCAKCHGPDGKGATRMGRQSGAKDYTDPKVQAEMTDEKAARAIKEGLKDSKGKDIMKPMPELTDEEVKGLIAILRSFKK